MSVLVIAELLELVAVRGGDGMTGTRFHHLLPNGTLLVDMVGLHVMAVYVHCGIKTKVEPYTPPLLRSAAM